MNPHDRSRQDYYEDEFQRDYYEPAPRAIERLPYPDAAAHLYQQNAMQSQVSRAHGNGMPQYAQGDMRYFDQMQQSGFNNAAQRAYYKQPQSEHEGAMHRRERSREGDGHRRERLQETRDDERYEEIYQEVFAPQSRMTISGTRTSTERTRGVQTTSSSRSSTSRYGSSSTSSSESDINLGEGIMSALNDMAGNLKNIGGIRCNQAGPDTTELQVKLNLPLPIEVHEGFNNAIATLSPKECGNMQYEYGNLDTHVMDMEEKFLGTMDQIQGNMMPVYKSLFESQSESSDEDESESAYEDERLRPNAVPNLQQHQHHHHQQYETTHVNGIPSQIVISNQPSGVSSAGSWNLLSPRDEPRRHPNNVTTIINNNIDVAKHGSRSLPNVKDGIPRDEQWIPASRQTLEVENLETPTPNQRKKKVKSKSRDIKSNTKIPQVIDVDGENVAECYSDLTSGFRKSAQPNAEKDKSTSNVPAIETQFSGDEVMRHSKASFQRNSKKKGTAFNPDSNGQTEEEAAGEKSDHPTSESQSVPKQTGNESKQELLEDDPDPKLEEARRLNEEREKAEKLEEEQKQREAEAKAAQKALAKKKLEDKVEAELQAAREALQKKKLEEQRKQREAEARVAEQKALEQKRLEEEAKRLDEERKLREAEARAAEEALRLETERKRIEAEAKAEQIALEAKRLEGERKQREAEEKAAEEARKAQELEKERKRIEAETKAAQEALDALYAMKLNEERRQREAKVQEERKQLVAEKKVREARKLKEVRERVEAEAKAAEEEAKKLERERMRIEAETEAVKNTLESRKLEKERKLIEAEKVAENARKARKLEKERKRLDSNKNAHSEEKGRHSLYKVQGFDDYCRSVASFQIDADGNRNDIDLSDEDTKSGSDVYSHEEDSTVGSSSFDDQSHSSNSVDTYSSGEESEIYTDATSVAEDTDDVRSASTTERLRNNIGIAPPFSSEKSVNTIDRTVGSSKSFSKSKFPTKQSKFTSDVPIPIAATMSTLQTFDQGTVISGQHSLGRFIKSSDESVVSSYSHQSVISAKPVALPVNALPREAKKENKKEPDSRSSIVGNILSFVLTIALRIMFTVILFSYKWIKHLVVTIGKKQDAKIDCTPTKFALQPDQAIRREEIQDRSMDSRIHQNAIQQHYLGYEDPHQEEHYATTMILKPPSYLADDSDEVGTCVESIVPDAHYPSMSDGKISTWKITQKNTETSSLSSPPSTSFRVLKSAYSALSSKRESEKSNWLDHATIDDEMSYYE